MLYLCRILKKMTKLFVVGFPRDMDELQLARLFMPYGDIDLLTIVRDPYNGQSKGYGFIQMKDEADASLAIAELHNKSLGDRTLEVRLAEDKAAPAKPACVPVGRRNFPEPQASEPLRKKRPRLPK